MNDVTQYVNSQLELKLDIALSSAQCNGVKTIDLITCNSIG